MSSENKSFIPVKPCYSHIGGRLGDLLMEQFIEKGWIKKATGNDRHYVLTPKGEKAMTDLDIDLSLIPREKSS